MQLFEEELTPTEEPPKPELTQVATYLDPEDLAKLGALVAAGRGHLNKSEVIRQCIRLGFKLWQKRERSQPQ